MKNLPTVKMFIILVLCLVLNAQICRAFGAGYLPMRFTMGSPRPYRSEKPTKAEEFNRTGVLLPEYQLPATLNPHNVSKFLYLSPREGPPLTLLVTPCSGPISWTVSYVGPPEEDQQTEGSKLVQTRWPVKTLVQGSPLFTYKGPEAQNFSIPRVRAGLYRFEIKSLESPYPKSDSPNTVLLFATSNALDHLPGSFENFKGKRNYSLRFQQRRRKRRLTVSWSKSQDSHLSSYCLVVTSGAQYHPSTLCAAKNFLQNRPRVTRGSSFQEQQYRGVPEGLHCVRQTKLTLHGMKYNTNYNFTLYVVNLRNNVSNLVASDMLKFRKTPTQTLLNGRYTTVDLKKSDGLINFQYMPLGNATTMFHILPCGGGIVTAKLRANGIVPQVAEVIGHAAIKAPPLTPGKQYTLRVSSTPHEKISLIKVLATDEGSIPYPELSSKSVPWEFRSMRKCHQVTVGVEPAGAAKYCVLVREAHGPIGISSVTFPDQCGLNRRKRSEYAYEECEEKNTISKERALPFTVRKLEPGKEYLVQITAELKGQYLSYPLLGVRTKRSCLP